MAWNSSVNQTPATSAVGLYHLITELIASNWPKTQDSDGTTYSSAGTQVTSGASGTHGLGNAFAWLVMKDPAGLTQLCIQRLTNNQTYRIKYSPAAGFVGGSPSAHQVPSAADEYVILGAGTDASPTGAQWFTGTEASMRFNCNSLSVAPYTWWIATWPVGGGIPTGGGFFDGVVSPVTGVAFTSDNDPHVINIDVSGSLWSAGNLGAASYTAGNQPSLNTMAPVTAQEFTLAAPTSGCATDPDNGKDLLRVNEFHFSSGGYFKGVTQYMLWETTGNGTNQRPLGFTPSVVASQDHIVIGTMAAPWPTGTTPLI